MAFKKVKKYLVVHTVAKVIFLFGSTMICMGIILDVIMTVNILLPYICVVNYAQTICTQVNTTVANVQGCEGKKCLTANTTTAPCIRVFVNFNYTENSAKRVTTALLRVNEQNVLSTDVCSYKVRVNRFYWQNEIAVEEFRKAYGVPGSYKCFYDPMNLSRVIVRKEFSRSQVLHSILWPSAAIVVASILVVIFYCWVGCDVWGSRFSTVSWDKSLKRIEMEQEMKRRTDPRKKCFTVA